MNGIAVPVARWLILLLAATGIELLVHSGSVSAIFLASPSSTLQALGAMLPQPLLADAVRTLLETAAGMLLASVVGVGLGYALWRNALLGSACLPLLGALFASPLLLLYPIALVAFGRSPSAVIAMAVPYAVLPITLVSREALAGVSPTLIKAGRVMGLSERRIVRYILLPAAAPGIFGGLRLGFGYLLKSIISMEFLLNIGGLGTLVAEGYDLFDTPQMYAGILAILVLSVGCVALMNRGEGRLRHAR